MEIRLSSPDLFFDKRIERAAEQAKCFARIKWHEPLSCRFILVTRAMSKELASFQQHDDVIARLFMEDPHATVRTAMATYSGAADFMAQKAARVPARETARETAGDPL